MQCDFPTTGLAIFEEAVQKKLLLDQAFTGQRGTNKLGVSV
jgi:hypothetical protein